MNFLRIKVTLQDAVNTIHGVIIIPNPYSSIAIPCLWVLEIIKIKKKADVKRIMEYVFSFLVCQKYLTHLVELKIVTPRLDNYQFSQPS